MDISSYLRFCNARKQIHLIGNETDERFVSLSFKVNEI